MLHYAVLLLAGGVLAQQHGTTMEAEFARFQSGGSGRVSTESGAAFSYRVLSRMRDGDLETVEAHAAAAGPDDEGAAGEGGAALTDEQGFANLLVTLDHSDRAVEAFLTTADGRAFQLGRAAPPAEHYVWEAVPEGEGEGDEAQDAAEAGASSAEREADVLAVPGGEKDRSGQHVVDVFVGFSNEAAKRVTGSIRAKAQSLISWTNMALRNSKVTNGRLRLVGVATHPANPGLIPAIKQQARWFQKEMASSGADITFAVQVYNNDGPAIGRGQLGGRRASILVNKHPRVFAHEAGHLSGAMHCVKEGQRHSRYGIRDVTIMCYGTQPIFSNPAVRFGGKVVGVPGKANVAQGWRSILPKMSGYARHTIPFGAPAPQPRPRPQPRPSPPTPAPRKGGKLVAGRGYRVSLFGSRRLQVSGGRVRLSPPSRARNQQWRLQARGGGYALVSMQSQRCLAVQRASRATGAALVPWRCRALRSDVFVAVPAPGGSYMLRASHSGKCIGVAGGSLKQVGCSPGQRGQRFLFTG